MSEADFETIHTSPGVQTPPPRTYLSAFMGGNTFGVPLPAQNINALPTESTATDQARNQEAEKPSTAITDEDAEEIDRLARWLEKKEMEQANKYNRTVTISPLPDSATVADILPRIRGGVDSCYVSEFEETRVAIVTFKRSADAITYAEFCAESPIWSLWTFEMSRPGVPFTWERRAKVHLYKAAPGIGTAWKRGDIPTEPQPVVSGSRCLVYVGCKPHEVTGIYRALGLQKSQHARDQVEGMWIDGPKRDNKGNPVSGRLHVWYTSVKAAQEAKCRVTCLEYEYDPCSDSPEKLLLHLDEGDEVPIFRHHEPFVNLIELDQKTIITGVYEGIVDPSQAYWRCRAAAQLMPDATASLAARLQWSLQTNSGPNMMSTMPGTYQPREIIPPPAALSDPFLESQPISTGLAPPVTTSYRLGVIDQNNVPAKYQPFAASRAVPRGHHISPLEDYVARSQERQALGFPPYYIPSQDEALFHSIQPHGPFSSDPNHSNDRVSTAGVIGDAARNTNTNTTNKYSNLGGVNINPQSGRQPRSGFYDS